MAQSTIERPLPQSRPLSARLAAWRGLIVLIGQRFLFGVIVLLAIVYATHVALNTFGARANGTPFSTVLVQSAGESLVYVGNALRGDLGVTQPRSVAFRSQPVTDVLPIALSRSLGLLAVTFLISIAIGVPLGVAAALRRHSRVATGILIISFVGVSMPSFFAALFLQMAAIQYTRTFGQAIVPVGGFGWDKHLVLPMLVLAARPIAQLTRVTFVSVSEVLDRDFVRVAHSKGLRRSYILLRHIFRNAAVPILTTIAVLLRFSLSSLPVVEVYFGWGGMGQNLLQAIFNVDKSLTTALLISLGLLFILVNLILDISYTLIDPRLRDKPQAAGPGENLNLIKAIRTATSEIHLFFVNNRLSQWWQRRNQPHVEEVSPFKSILARSQTDTAVAEAPVDYNRWGAWRRGILKNPTFLLGSTIVLALIFLVLFGPRWAPYSPNTTQLIATIDGVMTVPPFPPSEAHPWGTDFLGRDILSLVIAGAQQTIILAGGVMLIRMIIGISLGIIAGWFSGSWLDRLIVGLVQAMAVFPTLLLAALLIFGIGFQGGMRTFLIALSLVGWGEIMELVRGEIMAIRPLPYIESAIAVGQRTVRLIIIHIIPNLAPALVSVLALEVAAVLLILGELGFLGIFIQGGASTDTFGIYSQVPEWGSLLSGVRNWTRSYPWTAFYPMGAFFIAILGFNLLSEGLRQLIESVGLVINRLFNRYTFGLMALAIGGVFWARNNTGEIVFYRQQALTFDGTVATEHVDALTDPALGGQALGSEGLKASADYIAAQFRQLGLQPAGEGTSYFQPETRVYQLLDETPQLTIEDGGQRPTYRRDFAVFPGPVINQGNVTAPVHLLALGTEAIPADNFADEIVLLVNQNDFSQVNNIRCRGLLIVAPEQSEISRQYTLSAVPPQSGCGLDSPVLWISEQTANRLLQGVGLSMFNLGEQLEELDSDAVLEMDTTLTASINIQSHTEETTAVNIIGHLPGLSTTLDNNLIIVAAPYDLPPLQPGENPLPGANDNASGVATLFEAVRTMQESGYEPFKTFLFVAYSGEGLPDMAAAPDARRFLEGRSTFANAFDIEGVIFLRGLGGGGDIINIWTRDASRLAKLMESASHLNNATTERVADTPTINPFVPDTSRDNSLEDIPQVGFSRSGWQSGARLSGDNRTFFSQENMTTSGRSLSLGLMILGREQNY